MRILVYKRTKKTRAFRFVVLFLTIEANLSFCFEIIISLLFNLDLICFIL